MKPKTKEISGLSVLKAMRKSPEEIRVLVWGSRKFREWRPKLSFKKASGRTADILVGKESAAVSRIHFTVAELAKAWGLSTETIRNIFRSEPGVLKIGRPESKYRRGYTTIRIPQDVAERVHR